MCDNNGGPIFHQTPERILNQDFGLGVNTGGRLVKDKDTRIRR